MILLSYLLLVSSPTTQTPKALTTNIAMTKAPESKEKWRQYLLHYTSAPLIQKLPSKDQNPPFQQGRPQ